MSAISITALLNHAEERTASDIHIATNQRPMLRIAGATSFLNTGELTAENVTNIMKEMLSPMQLTAWERDMELDCSITIAGHNCRVNAYLTSHGPAMAIRVIQEKIKTFEELAMPPVVERLIRLQKGLILVTGACGSGKSTTLASIIDCLNKTVNKHIIMIEDPIEYRFTSNRCLINQREVNSHTKSFAAALRSALRQDPDVIVLGELRDLETIQLAITAAETGHLVFGTLHTNSAPKTIDRIIDVFPTDDKPLIRTTLATSLRAIISQTLLPTQHSEGRVAAYEVLIAINSICNLIRENKLHQISSMMELGNRYGMCLMRQSIKKLQSDGIISEIVASQWLHETIEGMDGIIEPIIAQHTNPSNLPSDSF